MKNDLASHIRVIDKVPPQVAWLNEEEQTFFNNPLVTFVSANLINPGETHLVFNKWIFI